MSNRMNFLFAKAKLRRNLADSKKYREFFFDLFGQTPQSWTNRGVRP